MQSTAAQIAGTTLRVLKELPQAPGNKLPNVEREGLAL